MNNKLVKQTLYLIALLLTINLVNAANTTIDGLIDSFNYNFTNSTVSITAKSDSMADTNGNGVSDVLTIQLTTSVTSDNTLNFIVTLLDKDKLFINTTTKLVTSSDNTVQIKFPTELLESDKFNYTIEINTADNELVYREYKTETNVYSSYEKGTNITKVTDENVNNDFVRINLTVNSTQNITTNVTITLAFNSSTISKTEEKTLNNSLQIISINFDNETIKSTHYVGNFTIDKVVIGNKIFEFNQNTSIYNYEDFAKTSYIRTISDSRIDTNLNNLSEFLELNFTANITSADNYNLSYDLYDQFDNFVVSVSKNQTLGLGIQTVQTLVNGSEIYKTKINGPYVLSFVKLAIGNDTKDVLLNAHTTNQSFYTDYERPPLADLKVTLSSIFNETSNVTDITVNLSNIGTAPAFNVFLDIFDNVTYNNNRSLSFFTNEDKVTYQFNITNSSNASLTTAIADFDNLVDELNESNNIAQNVEENISVEADTTPPIINNLVNATTTNQSVRITWSTNENANETNTLGLCPVHTGIFSNSNNTLSMPHAQAISGLINSTLYCFNTTACDSSNNCASSNFSFTTAATIPPDIVPPTLTVLQPINNTIYAQNFIDLNWTSSETLDWCAYSLDGGANQNSICLENITYAGFNFSVTEQSTQNQRGIAWNGSIFLVVNEFNDSAYGFDSSGTYTGFNFSVASQDTQPGGLAFKGSSIFVAGYSTDKIYEYNSAGVYAGFNFSVANQAAVPSGLISKDNKFYVVDATSARVYEYSPSGDYTGFNFSVSGQDSNPQGITWDGSYFYVVGFTTKKVYLYDASGVYSGLNFATGSEDNSPNGIAWNGNSFFVIGSNTGRVYKYDNNPRNITLISLSESSHNLTIYGNDTSGNVGQSSYVYFKVSILPSYSNLKSSPISPVTYQKNQQYQFNVTWQDNSGISTALIEFNGINYTLSQNGNEYYRTFTDLAVGSYNYYFWANDTSGNSNKTDTFTYTINKATSLVYTYINNSRSNATIVAGTSIYLNGTLIAGEGQIQLYKNGTLINSGQSPLSNLTAFNVTGLYNITTIYPETQNYTSSYETWWVNVTQVLASPTIGINLVYPNANINVTQNKLFNFTVNVSCHNANCGEINISLDPESRPDQGRLMYTPTSETYCSRGVCNKISYIETRYVYEDNIWKKIENARSLKNASGIALHIVWDKQYPVRIIDYNYTQLNACYKAGITELNKDIPLEVYNKHNKSDIKFSTTSNLKTISEEKCFTVPFGFDSVVKWGTNSTTIQINSTNSNSGYIRDGDGCTGSGDYLYNSNVHTFAGNHNNVNGYQYRTFWGFNTSAINGTITNVEVIVYYQYNYVETTYYKAKLYQCNYGTLTLSDYGISVGTEEGTLLNSTSPTGTIRFNLDILHINTSGVTQYCLKPDFACVDEPEYWLGNDPNKPIYLNITYTEAPPQTGKGLINTTIGAIPFYTTGSNPQNITLNSGESQVVTWLVNATGTVDNTYTFFAFANKTSDMSISNITDKINITIREELQPPPSQQNLTITSLQAIYNNNTDYNFEFIIKNSGSTNLTNINWSLNTGLVTISSQQPLNLTANENTTIFVDFDYNQTGEYSVVATATDGINQDSESINVNMPDLEVMGLSVLNSSNKRRVFEFLIKNYLSDSLSNVTWNIKFGDGNNLNNTDIVLQPLENMSIYVDYTYSTANTYVVNASAVNGTLKGYHNITITVT